MPAGLETFVSRLDSYMIEKIHILLCSKCFLATKTKYIIEFIIDTISASKVMWILRFQFKFAKYSIQHTFHFYRINLDALYMMIYPKEAGIIKRINNKRAWRRHSIGLCVVLLPIFQYVLNMNMFDMFGVRDMRSTKHTLFCCVM